MKNFIQTATALVFLLIFSCSQYEDNRGVKLIVKFPQATKSYTESLFKPSDVQVNYVPSFVKGIEVGLKEGEEESYWKCFGACPDRSPDESLPLLNAELDLGEIPYGVYKLEIRAFAYNENNSEGNKFIKTHEAVINDWKLGINFENLQFIADLQPSNSGNGVSFDENPFTIDAQMKVDYGTVSVPRNGYYATCIDNDGNIGVVWLTEESENNYDFYIKKYDVDGQPENLANDNFTIEGDDAEISDDCFFIGNDIYFAYSYYSLVDLIYYIKIARFQNNDNTFDDIHSYGSTLLSTVPRNFDFQVAANYAVLSWSEVNNGFQRNFSQTFDLDMNQLSNRLLTNGRGNLPRVLIVDESRFATLSRVFNSMALLSFPRNLFEDPEYSGPAYLEIAAGVTSFLSPFVSLKHTMSICGDDKFFIANDSGEDNIPDGSIAIYVKDLEGNSYIDENSFLISNDDVDEIDRRSPVFKNVRGYDTLAVWSEDKIASAYMASGYYNISFYLFNEPRTISDADYDTVFKPFDVVENVINYSGARVSVNDDGLAVIAATVTDILSNTTGKIYFKRYLF